MTSLVTQNRPPLLEETAAVYPSERGRMASFAEELEEYLLGERVVVQSRDGHRFEGTLVRIQHQHRHVLLTDVMERPTGELYQSMTASRVDWVVQLPDDPHPTPEE